MSKPNDGRFARSDVTRAMEQLRIAEAHIYAMRLQAEAAPKQEAIYDKLSRARGQVLEAYEGLTAIWHALEDDNTPNGRFVKIRKQAINLALDAEKYDRWYGSDSRLECYVDLLTSISQLLDTADRLMCFIYDDRGEVR